jgi:hypothetical protein
MKTVRIIAITAFLATAFLGSLNEATKTAPVQPRPAVPAVAHSQTPIAPDEDCLPGYRPDLPCLTSDEIKRAMQVDPDITPAPVDPKLETI